MREIVEILGVKIDKLTADYALKKAIRYLDTPDISVIFTPNPEILVAAAEDPDFRRVLNTADLCTADGIGVVYASRMLKNPVPERVTGYDLARGLLQHCSQTGDGVFLFGAKPGVAEKAKAKLEAEMPGIRIVGTQHGYFTAEEDQGIVEQINQSGARLLLVCLGAPKQEKWIDAHRGQLHVSLCMGLGGALDGFAGEVKRAPKFFIKCNLEWLYRLCKQPSRFKRYGALPKFMMMVKQAYKG